MNRVPNLNAPSQQLVGGSSWIPENKTYLFIGLAVLIIFGCVAYYLYSQSQSTSESYAINRESGTNSDPGKVAELMLFSVDWCPHCKTARPEWDELKSEYEGKTINGYKVIFSDINCTEETVEVENKINKYKIEGYPTIKLLKDGQVIEYDAKPTKKTMEEFLNTVL